MIFIRSVCITKILFEIKGSLLQSVPSQLSSINIVNNRKMEIPKCTMYELVLIVEPCITKILKGDSCKNVNCTISFPVTRARTLESLKFSYF